MKFKRLLEGLVPYTGEVLKVYERIVNNNSTRTNTLYYNEEIGSLWFVTKNEYVHIVKFQKFHDGLIQSLGFPDEMLNKQGELVQKGTIWALPIKKFKEDFKNQSDAEKFIDACIKKLEGVDVRNAFEIIDELHNSFKG